MNIKVIYHVMGRLIYALAISLMVPMLAALLWDEPWHAFAMSVAICFVIGALLTKAGKATNDKLSLREGVAITGLSWFVASSIAAVPYYLGTDMGIIDCMFVSFADPLVFWISSSVSCTATSYLRASEIITTILFLSGLILYK